MRPNLDGSLTIYVQPDHPANERRDNWLPAPEREDFSLHIRAYWPKVKITELTDATRSREANCTSRSPPRGVETVNTTESNGVRNGIKLRRK